MYLPLHPQLCKCTHGRKRPSPVRSKASCHLKHARACLLNSNRFVRTACQSRRIFPHGGVQLNLPFRVWIKVFCWVFMIQRSSQEYMWPLLGQLSWVHWVGSRLTGPSAIVGCCLSKKWRACSDCPRSSSRRGFSLCLCKMGRAQQSSCSGLNRGGCSWGLTLVLRTTRSFTSWTWGCGRSWRASAYTSARQEGERSRGPTWSTCAGTRCRERHCWGRGLWRSRRRLCQHLHQRRHQHQH